MLKLWRVYDGAWMGAHGVLRLIEERAGRGTFMYTRSDDPDEFGHVCPFCDCRSYFAFLDDEWKGNQSSPDDAFECAICGATSTRRDLYGCYHAEIWDKDRARTKKAPATYKPVYVAADELD